MHFNLGLAYMQKQDYERAREEFHKDIALEPDVPFSYDKLGGVEATAGNEEEAAKNFRSALKLNPQMDQLAAWDWRRSRSTSSIMRRRWRNSTRSSAWIGECQRALSARAGAGAHGA